MKIKTTVHIYFSKYSWEPKGEYLVLYVKIEEAEHQTYVCSQEIEIEVPEDFDPRAQQIAALEAKKIKTMADYQKSVTEINERISKLTALEYTA
jgi:hypothetical protein